MTLLPRAFEPLPIIALSSGEAYCKSIAVIYEPVPLGWNTKALR